MEWKKDKVKQIRNLVLFIAAIVFCLMYSGQIIRAVVLFFEMLSPFLAGGMIAFVLNIPMCLIEERLLKKWQGRAADKCRRPVSMILSIVLVALLLVLLLVTVVPQLAQTIRDLQQKIPAFVNDVFRQLELLAKDYPELEKYLTEFESREIPWDQILTQAVTFLKEGGTQILTTTIGVARGVISSVVNGVISFIFAMYILAAKEKLGRQAKKLLHAYAKPQVESCVLKVCSMLYRNFSRFITGQCLEAVILGTIFVVVLTIFRMPYAVMIGVLIAFTALIPVVGAFIGCIVGAFLILVDSPVMALGFVVLFLIIQQIEGNLIYPKVVGESVGLPAIWVLVAVTVGGSLFGVAGMVVFIPLVSTAYMLLREDVNFRIGKKNESQEQQEAAQRQGEKEEKQGETAHQKDDKSDGR